MSPLPENPPHFLKLSLHSVRLARRFPWLLPILVKMLLICPFEVLILLLLLLKRLLLKLVDLLEDVRIYCLLCGTVSRPCLSKLAE